MILKWISNYVSVSFIFSFQLSICLFRMLFENLQIAGLLRSLTAPNWSSLFYFQDPPRAEKDIVPCGFVHGVVRNSHERSATYSLAPWKPRKCAYVLFLRSDVYLDRFAVFAVYVNIRLVQKIDVLLSNPVYMTISLVCGRGLYVEKCTVI